jgi:hypothetical protein
MTSTIRINDLFDDLGEENKNLLQRLELSKKCFILLEKYRFYLNLFRNKCKFNSISIDFKTNQLFSK